MEPIIKEKAEKWLNSNIDQEAKAAIRSMLAEESQELTDSFYKDLEFGTGGLRGIMGVGSNRMNKYTIGMATQGLANYLNKTYPDEQVKVAIAHDSRNNSTFFAQTTAAVFSANGIQVYFFEGLRPTPELSFAIRHLGCHSGVVLTASHNPKEYNGYKAYWNDGAQMVSPHDKNVIQEVSNIQSLDEVQFDRDDSKIQSIGADIDAVYLAAVKNLSLSPDAISSQRDLKIVFSPIHGTGITLVPAALEQLGFTNVTVVDEQAEPNGNFPTVVYPNPEEKEAMTLALKKAEAIDADLVMATDPDADRVGIAVKNNKGEFQLMNGNQTGSLLVWYLLEAWKNNNKLDGEQYVAKTIVTTELIDTMAAHYNVSCYNTLTGFKYIASLIRELEGVKTFIGGGEESYGYMISDFVRDKDAVASCAMIAEMVAYIKNKGLSLFDQLIDIYTTHGFYRERLISITRKGKSGAEEIQEMMRNMRENPPATINGAALVRQIDYHIGIEKNIAEGTETVVQQPKSNVLQFYTADGSKISMRPSGTEPKIKFYFSVNAPLDNKANYEAVEASLEARIDAIIEDMKLN